METNALGLYAGAWVLGTILSAWLFSLFFNNSKKIKLLRMQVNLLFLVAEKLGVDKAEMEKKIAAINS